MDCPTGRQEVFCRGVENVLVGQHGMFLWETESVLSRGKKCSGGAAWNALVGDRKCSV